MATLSVYNIGETYATWIIDNLNNSFTSSYYISAGVTNYTFTGSGVSSIGGIAGSKYATSSGGYSVTGTVYGLIPGTSYTWWGFAQAANGLYYNTGAGRSFRTLSPAPVRPPKFYWDSGTKYRGEPFYLTASEWNKLFSNINLVRAYKGVGNYYPTAVYRGDVFKASYYNQARSAIQGIGGGAGYYIPYVSAGDAISAYMLNILVSEINAVN